MSFNQVTAEMSTIQSELKRLTSFWLSDRIGLYGSRASCRSASFVPSTDRQVKRGRTLRTSSLLQQQIGSTSPFIFTGTKSKGSSRSTVCHYPRKTSGPRRPVLTERLRQTKRNPSSPSSGWPAACPSHRANIVGQIPCRDRSSKRAYSPTNAG